MTVDEHGRYIPRVEGVPVEGEEKLAALKRFADAEYGVGKWRIRAAYSDHYSDRPLLAAAEEAVAVWRPSGCASASVAAI
jgi:phosphoserine phosphatase